MPERIASEARLRRRERVLSQSADGSLVLLDVDGGEYFALEEVAARVWDLCDGDRTVSAVVETVATEYDASPEAVEADVLAFLEEMIQENLLVREATA